MKYAHIEANNTIIGWYDDGIHEYIPEPYVQVTEEQWLLAVSEGHNHVAADGTTSFVDLRTPEQIAAALQEQQNRLHRRYLADTDWYVIRAQETGVAVPQDILDARQAARAAIV